MQKTYALNADAKHGRAKSIIVEKIKRRPMSRPLEASTQAAVPQRDVKFPLCDAAVRKMEGGKWELADAILAECSEPGEDGVRNESYAEMMAMRQEIASTSGVDLSLERIRKLRKVASAFPAGRRRPGVSVEGHLEAGTPEALDELIKAAPNGYRTHPRIHSAAEAPRPRRPSRTSRRPNARRQSEEQRHGFAKRLQAAGTGKSSVRDAAVRGPLP